ncbi:LysR family transcriptional regulator [Hyphococcus sp.]|uniref:LysR family transcriptional regulator n=1 Tax=Hyphococcus sp. TaxID=2038636 RepID=UPI003CCC35C3
MKAQWPNLWHLQVFLIVLQTQNLSRAAIQLQLTQSAVSQAVARLETYFEASLASRDATRVHPTPFGEIVAVRAERAYAFLSESLRDAANIPNRRVMQIVRTISASRLQALVAVARYQGFAAAARSVDISAPSLHRAARDLERTLEIELFESTSFGVRPNRKAERIARAAALAFSEISQARAEIDAKKGKGSGSTVIGAMPLARTHLVPASVEMFSRDYPDHRFTIIEGAYDDLLAGLRRGDIDILVGALREDLAFPNIVQEEVFADQLALVMRAAHPLAQGGRLTKSSLRKFAWVAPRAESPLRRHFESLFAPEEPPEDLIECNSLGAVRVILMNSNRLALLSDAQIRYEKKAGMLVAKTAPGPARVRSIGLTKRQSWEPTEIQHRFLTLLKKNARMK